MLMLTCTHLSCSQWEDTMFKGTGHKRQVITVLGNLVLLHYLVRSLSEWWHQLSCHLLGRLRSFSWHDIWNCSGGSAEWLLGKVFSLLFSKFYSWCLTLVMLELEIAKMILLIQWGPDGHARSVFNTSAMKLVGQSISSGWIHASNEYLQTFVGHQMNVFHNGSEMYMTEEQYTMVNILALISSVAYFVYIISNVQLNVYTYLLLGWWTVLKLIRLFVTFGPVKNSSLSPLRSKRLEVVTDQGTHVCLNRW
jgi:hypothetical protein